VWAFAFGSLVRALPSGACRGVRLWLTCEGASFGRLYGRSRCSLVRAHPFGRLCGIWLFFLCVFD